MNGQYMDTNALLKSVFAEARDVEIERALSADIDTTPSERFKTGIEKLIRSRKKFYWRFTNTRLKRAICIIVLILLLLAIPMSVEAIRRPVINFIINIFSDHTSVNVDVSGLEVPKSIEHYYNIPDELVPEGFEITDNMDSDISHTVYYFNDEKEFIYFSQYILSGHHLLDSEDVEYIEVSTDTVNGFYIQRKDKKYNTLMWYTQKYAFVLDASDCVSFEKLIEIAESLEINS